MRNVPAVLLAVLGLAVCSLAVDSQAADRREDFWGVIASDSAMPAAGAVRSAEEWMAIRLLFPGLSKFSLDFTQDALIYARVPAQVDAGSAVQPLITILGQEGNMLKLSIRFDWSIEPLPASKRLYRLIKIPKHDGPIQITWELPGAYGQYAKLLPPMLIPEVSP